jgi:conjugal transfer pilus assembly protein TraU
MKSNVAQQSATVALCCATLHFRGVVMKITDLWIALFLFHSPLAANEGKLINPITDICWNCIFPLHVAGVNTTRQHQDPVRYNDRFCFCAGLPPKAGIPVAFWEPTHMVDVSRVPYKLLGLGGISIGKSDVRKQGAVSHVGDSGRASFYNVHYYAWPVLHWLEVLTKFPCVEKSVLEVPYLSEFDPFWGDDEWSVVFSPESLLFANPLAQLSCTADCVSASVSFPQDSLFWCAGCSGSLYPLTGHVPHHVGATQASFLLLQRLLAKMHSLGLGKGYGEHNFCEKQTFPRLKKSLYKTQLAYPVAATRAPCPPLGQSELHWGSGKSFPYKGEDFVYLVWTKKHCCLDAIQLATPIPQ